MTVTSEATVRFERHRPPHATKHLLTGHRPLHRRRVSPFDRLEGFGLALGVARNPVARGTEESSGRNYRNWALVTAIVAWGGFVTCHFVGASQAMAVFAAIDALTWGFALAAIVPTENGLEFSMIAVASSFAVLILAGMLLVELRLTGAFFWIFLGVGAASLCVQIAVFCSQIASLRLEHAPPQKVPSIIDGRIVMEDR